MFMRAETLSSRLREHTRDEHAAARRSSFIEGLASGRLPFAAYAELAAQHWFIYESLELAASAMSTDPVARHFVFPELFRIPALEADLRYLYGARWQSRVTALPSTSTYCTRIRYAAVDQDTGYVAHHCTRYLGDLAGGQWLGRAIVAAYGLRRQGYRFFVFEGVDPPLFRARYRDRLNAVRWTRPEQDAFLAEVSAAFRLNIDMLAELGEHWT
ncbi:biliverdin-producing heme oxygenase [Actinoplanes sp. NEAU-A11]|uniref:Biliverdin-producing heme oxygenase n=2 Tax=Actinoplanes aureus TaxID=2792083 RepID=A0A931CK32_9ACTN|nr:biliverdin-producing heme oxygenase [Actinoplanes aureus]